MSSNVLQPNPPHEKTSFFLFLFSLSQQHEIKNSLARNALLQPPKKSHLHHCLNYQKKHFFHRIMWASLGFLGLGQSCTEKTGKREPSHPPLSLSLSPSFLPLSLSNLFFYFFYSCLPIFLLSSFSSRVFFLFPPLFLCNCLFLVFGLLFFLFLSVIQ